MPTACTNRTTKNGVPIMPIMVRVCHSLMRSADGAINAASQHLIRVIYSVIESVEYKMPLNFAVGNTVQPTCH